MLSIVAFDLTTTSSFEDVRPPVLDAQLHAPFGFAYIPVVPTDSHQIVNVCLNALVAPSRALVRHISPPICARQSTFTSHWL